SGCIARIVRTGTVAAKYRQHHTTSGLPDRRSKDSAPAAPLQRKNGDARAYPCERSETTGRSGFTPYLHDGMVSRSAAVVDDSVLSVDRLELGTIDQQVSGRNRRSVGRGGSGSTSARGTTGCGTRF